MLLPASFPFVSSEVETRYPARVDTSLDVARLRPRPYSGAAHSALRRMVESCSTE